MPLEEFNRLGQETLHLAELMVPFRSQLAGRTLAEVGFRERYGLNVLAAHRLGQALRKNLPRLRLEVGDTLLVQGPLLRLQRVGRDQNLILVTHLGPQRGDLVTGKAKLTLGILAAMVLCVVSGLLSLAVASLAAAVALILSRCISADRAYRSIRGNVIVLIGGMLPLAMALEKTGAANLIAEQIAGLGPAIGPLGTLAVLYVFTVVTTQVITNSATAALVTPIAVSLATAQGVSPEPFAMAMAIAATTSYLTPLTNADNLLVREAGGYTIRDYVTNGLPVVILQAMAVMVLLVMQYTW
jgi:di/tricarboxylate transporter